MKSSHLLGGLALALAVVIAIVVVSQRGYGKVSSRAYEFSKAIYGACLSQSEARLAKVEKMLDEDAGQVAEGTASVEQVVSLRERQWLESMIQLARDGQWKSAAKQCRRMMNDQVSE
jgi:hypothetical protein